MATQLKTERLKSGAARVGGAVKDTARKAGSVAKSTASKAEAKLKTTTGPSPNPMTNLIMADIAIRGGGRLLRHVVERTLLGAKYPPEKARQIVKGRGMKQTLLGTAAARLATNSVPGALIVGGSLLAKTLYDRKHRMEQKVEGEIAVQEQAQDA